MYGFKNDQQLQTAIAEIRNRSPLGAFAGDTAQIGSDLLPGIAIKGLQALKGLKSLEGLGSIVGKTQKAEEIAKNAEEIAKDTLSKPITTYSYNTPGKRHDYTRINMDSHTKKINTIILPGVDYKADVAAINAGKAIKKGDKFIINGRTYGIHNNALHPRSGNGLITLDRGGHKALKVYKKFGNTLRSEQELDRMDITKDARNEALKVYKIAENIIKGG